MRRAFFILAVLSMVFVGSAIATQPAPVYAEGAGCVAINGASFSTDANQAYITDPLQFAKEDQLVYTLTWSFADYVPSSITLWISYGTAYNPVAEVTVGGNATQAVLTYEFPSAINTALRFDWSFSGSGIFAPHTIMTAINCGAGFFQGPPIPSGFELHTIVCDVPVYNLPGGTPVGDNKITSGQTWYVNPKPVSAADGSLWTEIFVSGYTNGYIPTSCVG